MSAARTMLLGPRWVLPGASLDFDFERGRYFQQGVGSDIDKLITVSRASTGYVDDIYGNWLSIGSNLPRIGVGRGLGVEEDHTNSIRNNSMQGAAIGTNGTMPTNWARDLSTTGLSRQVVAIGVENGIDYIDLRYFGTSTAADYIVIATFDTANGIAASTGQTWTISTFVKLQAGSIANLLTQPVLRVNENTAGGVFVANVESAAFTPTEAALGSQRRVFSPTLSGGGTVGAVCPYLFVTVANATVYDFTLRIGWPQLELGAFVTSPIRTTSAAATRAADNDNNTLPLANASSLVVSGVTAAGIGSTNQFIWQCDDGAGNNRIRVVRDTSRVMRAIVTVGGFQQANLDLGVVNDNTAFKIGFAWAANDFAASLNGAAVVVDASGSVPSGLTTQRLGSSNSGEHGNIYMRRQALFVPRLPNNELMKLTTP